VCARLPELAPGRSYSQLVLWYFRGVPTLTMSQAENLRIVGYAHADEPGYDEWLSYYKAVIHCFVACTRDIAACTSSASSILAVEKRCH
jgi:hypothetical protein